MQSYAETVAQIQSKSEQLGDARRTLLDDAAESVRQLQESGTAHLLFVCTHNSRRSQFSEVWARVALSRFAASNIEIASCGTEVTECNPRTVESLRRLGFAVSSNDSSENPIYAVQATNDSQQPATEFELFSKAFGHESLPTSAIVAMMCCDDADQKCPIVPGAEARVALHYRDPKESDGTDAEAQTYDSRSQEIGAEMFYLIRQLAT